MLDLVVQLLLHQMFNIEPIAFAAGNSSAGSMGLFQQTDVLQYGHLIADGCAGTVEVRRLISVLEPTGSAVRVNSSTIALKMSICRCVSITVTPFSSTHPLRLLTV